MESAIDQRYRLELISKRLEGFEETPSKKSSAVFYCPLCQSQRNREKYHQKKGAYFWNAQSHSWRFNCVKCHPTGISMYNYLAMLDQEMARRYQMDRWQSGTTGKGHDCPNPPAIAERSGISPSASTVSSQGRHSRLLAWAFQMQNRRSRVVLLWGKLIPLLFEEKAFECYKSIIQIGLLLHAILW